MKLKRVNNEKSIVKMGYSCHKCPYSTTRKSNLERHLESHDEKRELNPVHSQMALGNTQNTPANGPPISEVKIDLRLIPNFKLFICGPSRCGKTYFVYSLISNIKRFCQSPPDKVVYVYGANQAWDEWEQLIDIFIPENEDPINKIYDLSKSYRLCVVFDDLLHSKDMYAAIAKLFTIDGRHNNMSLIYLSQRFFVNDENFRQITGNADYYCLFKNPKDPSQINHLSYRMTPKGSDSSLIGAYKVATLKPYSYIFVNCTQTVEEDYKFLGSLFEKPDFVYCFRKAPYSTDKKIVYKGYQLFHKNFIVTTLKKNTNYFVPNPTLRPEIQLPDPPDTDPSEEDQLNLPDPPNTDPFAEDPLDRNNETPPPNLPPPGPNTNNNKFIPKPNMSRKRVFPEVPQIENDDDSNDSLYSLISDRIDIGSKRLKTIDYCELVDKLKKKIIDLITLRDHLLLKCGRVSQIKRSDVEAAVDTDEYTLYLKPKKK